MNSLFKNATNICKNKTNLQFLKKVSLFNFSSVNRFGLTQTVTKTTNSTLINFNKKYFWKKEDKNKENLSEKKEDNVEDKNESDDKVPKGFEKFHRKKKDEKKDEKESKDNNEDPNKNNNDEDPNKSN
jgi:hypothetical protein